MCLIYLLFFVLFGAAELYLIYQAGVLLGAFDTALLLLLSAVIGLRFAKRQGLEAMQRVQRGAWEGNQPAGEMFDSALILVGGIFLIVPGFLSDLLGATLLVPQTRRLWKRYSAGFIRRRLERGSLRVHRF